MEELVIRMIYEAKNGINPVVYRTKTVQSSGNLIISQSIKKDKKDVS